MVKWSKRLLPIVSLTALIVTAGYLWLSRLIGDVAVDVDVTQSVVNDGKLVMANPSVTGFTKDNRAYKILATRAIQSMSGDESVELDALLADFELEGGQTAKLTAESGFFDRAKNELLLSGPSVFSTSEGFVTHFSSAQIGIDGGNFTTKEAVRVERPGTTITANAMAIENNGKRIVFENAVRLVIQGDAVQTLRPPKTKPELTQTELTTAPRD